MGIFSSAAPITRYLVEGTLKSPAMETVAEGLRRNTISEIDGDAAEKAAGWTSFEAPFQPDFDGYSFIYGSFFVFSLRIDRKQIPVKLVNKHLHLETSKRLAKTRRSFLSQDEKQALRQKVISELAIRMPAIPSLFDVIWDHGKAHLYFFSNLRSANEELEALFKRAFMLSLIRIIPYTAADLLSGLTDQERDLLLRLSPTHFSG